MKKYYEVVGTSDGFHNFNIGDIVSRDESYSDGSNCQFYQRGFSTAPSVIDAQFIHDDDLVELEVSEDKPKAGDAVVVVATTSPIHWIMRDTVGKITGMHHRNRWCVDGVSSSGSGRIHNQIINANDLVVLRPVDKASKEKSESNDSYVPELGDLMLDHAVFTTKTGKKVEVKRTKCRHYLIKEGRKPQQRIHLDVLKDAVCNF
jgi:hypothetical protein